MAKHVPRCIAPTGAKKTRFHEEPAYAEGLWDLGNSLYAWMVPNGSWGESNSGLVVGEGQSLLIDTLWDLNHTQIMLDGMEPILRKFPLQMLVNTHADGDHFWGNQLIEDHVVSITSEAARNEMDHHKPRTMIAFASLGKYLRQMPTSRMHQVGHWFETLCMPYKFGEVEHTPSRETFSGTVWKDIGGRRLQLIEVGPAHTKGDLMVYVPDAKTLFAGDILFIGSTPVMWAGPVENWIRALDLILGLDVDIIVPGHGPLTDKDGVRLVKTYWEFVHGAARKCFDNGASAANAAHEIITSPAFVAYEFSNWDSPERMMTNVHLLYCQFRGKSSSMSVLAKINLMRKQALLAHKLPHARPAVMRTRDASL